MAGKKNHNNRDIQRQSSHSALVIESMSRSFSGPLPPSEELDKYNRILPGAAERILAMAEKQQNHRQELEKKAIFGNADTQKQGLWLGFALAMTTVIGGVWLISLGREVTGLAAIITALGSLVGVFVYGKYRQKKDLDSKPKPLN